MQRREKEHVHTSTRRIRLGHELEHIEEILALIGVPIEVDSGKHSKDAVSQKVENDSPSENRKE